MNQRGIYEKSPGSGVCWIRYVDAQGRLRREKAGTKSAAILLYRKRKQEALEGRKLPEKLRRAPVPTLADFSKRFLDAIRIRCSTKPRTIEFYAQQTRHLLALEALANRRLDEIDEAAVEEFAQARRQHVGPATTNRGLAVLPRFCAECCAWRTSGVCLTGFHGFTFCEGSGTVSSSSAGIRSGSTSSFVRRFCTTSRC
jgi:hypothetical protein